MELERVTKGKQIFPDGGTSEHVKLVFRDGDNAVVKSVKVSATAHSVLRKEEIFAETRHLILLKAREAERDFAYMKYGDKWKEHVPWGHFWGTEMTAQEAVLVKSAGDMMEAING